MSGTYNMKEFIFLSVIMATSTAVLSGCATANKSHVNYSSMSYEKPAVIQTQPSQSDYQLAYGNDKSIQNAYEQYLKTGKAPNIITSGFEQFAFGASQPVISASPFELTVATLEKGESVSNVSSGDPLRWSYSLAYSGAGKDREAHVMIKPSQPGISTDMIITTDKRMYTLKLVSTNNGKYLRNVKFWYPDEIQKYWESYNATQSQGQQNQGSGLSSDISQLPDIHLGQLNFNYSIHTPFFSSPQWKPTRVFDDGVHTYIQVPDSVSSDDLPALFVTNANTHAKSLVNYRFKKPYFIVDKIFKEAMMVLGVGHSQSKVTIINETL